MIELQLTLIVEFGLQIKKQILKINAKFWSNVVSNKKNDGNRFKKTTDESSWLTKPTTKKVNNEVKKMK